jgi:hypothetical protein
VRGRRKEGEWLEVNFIFMSAVDAGSLPLLSFRASSVTGLPHSMSTSGLDCDMVTQLPE